MNTESPSNSYDTLPYPAYTFPVTHIGRLAAIGRVFGLETPDPSKARVLELGCGTGTNLIALAQIYPEAAFVGVDASARQIEEGVAAIAETGVGNVRLVHADIAEIGNDLGMFDYIITHGIYSWVSPKVREAILRISKEHLHPTGIAYISYNSLPGWRMRGALREMMLMHTSGIAELPGKVAQAKALLKFLAESCSEDTPYGNYLRRELEMLQKADDSYIAHEFLEEENTAFYFTDFLKGALAQGLNYLSDTDPATMIADNLPAQAAETLKGLNLNLPATEQYMDFVRNRMFRSSLLCHADAPLVRQIDPARLEGMEAVALAALKKAEPDGQSAVFVGPNGNEITVTNPVAISLFSTVAAAGRRARPVSEIIDEVATLHSDKLAGQNPDDVRADLGRLLIQGYLKKLVDFYVCAEGRPVAAADNDKPCTLPLARWQAQRGLRVSSPRLDMLTTDPFISKLIGLCDGQRDRTAIIDAMTEAVGRREFQLNENNTPVEDPERARLIIEQLYDGSLQNLDQLGLLLPRNGGNGGHA